LAAACNFSGSATKPASTVPILRNAILFVASQVRVSIPSNLNQKASEVPKKSSEFTNMSAAEFAQFAMTENIAPRWMGSVKTRLTHAQRELGKRDWTPNRVRDLWYRDPRASAPKWEEINDLEQITGLEYARQELRSNDQLISTADALLEGVNADFYGPLLAALRAFAGAVDRSGAGRGRTTGTTNEGE
jgi:hypothetical protein